MLSLSSSGDRLAPRHAIVLAHGSSRAEQRFVPDVDVKRATSVLAVHARQGFHPALVSMAGSAERPLLAFVLERTSLASWLLPPQPFRDRDFFLNKLAKDPNVGLLVDLAVAGAPVDDLGTGLVVAGVFVPQTAPRVAWAVHLERVDEGAWRDLQQVRTLETVARPVVAIPIRGDDGARWVASVWHDRVLSPWPTPDPFAPARRFECLEIATASFTQPVDQEIVGVATTRDGAQAITLLGESALERQFLISTTVASAERPTTVPSSASPLADRHPLDRWMRDYLGTSGARHAQLVVVRQGRLSFARAYTYAEAGYPVATLDHAFRLGSVSKALTTMALLPALRQRDIPIDQPIASLLELPEDAPPLLRRITFRHLLTHDAGFRTFIDIQPDEPDNPLSESNLTARLHGAPRVARPGELSALLRIQRDESIFARTPGSGTEEDYSNEAFILLGELLSKLELGRFDGFEQVISEALFARAGIRVGARGAAMAAGRKGAVARLESPAHPIHPTWARDRFDEDAGPTLTPYTCNGPFLGAAAGLCVPLVWVARVLALLGPHRDQVSLWKPMDAERALSPATPGSRGAHGVYVGGSGWWTFHSARRAGRAPVPERYRRIHHNGRLDGCAALLVHQMRILPADEPSTNLDGPGTLSLVMATNQLGPLYDEPHARQLFDILRDLEGSDGWDEQDLFAHTDSASSTHILEKS